MQFDCVYFYVLPVTVKNFNNSSKDILFGDQVFAVEKKLNYLMKRNYITKTFLSNSNIRFGVKEADANETEI